MYLKFMKNSTRMKNSVFKYLSSPERTEPAYKILSSRKIFTSPVLLPGLKILALEGFRKLGEARQETEKSNYISLSHSRLLA